MFVTFTSLLSLRQTLMSPKLARVSSPPASTSLVLGLQVCSIMSGLQQLIFFMYLSVSALRRWKLLLVET